MLDIARGVIQLRLQQDHMVLKQLFGPSSVSQDYYAPHVLADRELRKRGPPQCLDRSNKMQMHPMQWLQVYFPYVLMILSHL